MAFSRTRLQSALLLGVLACDAGCAETQPHEQVQVAKPSIRPVPLSVAPIAQASPYQPNAGSDATPGPDGKPIVFNDPPAAPDTPLCGRQTQEINAIGAGLQGTRVAASGICARFACYDPLTATYIGADGYRHVCR